MESGIFIFWLFAVLIFCISFVSLLFLNFFVVFWFSLLFCFYKILLSFIIFRIYSKDRVEGWYNWSLVGIVSYTLVFQTSIRVTERLSLEKYPRYRAYLAQTSKLIPLPFKIGNAHIE